MKDDECESAYRMYMCGKREAPVVFGKVVVYKFRIEGYVIIIIRLMEKQSNGIDCICNIGLPAGGDKNSQDLQHEPKRGLQRKCLTRIQSFFVQKSNILILCI